MDLKKATAMKKDPQRNLDEDVNPQTTQKIRDHFVKSGEVSIFPRCGLHSLLAF
jgi:hypothetical protein